LKENEHLVNIKWVQSYENQKAICSVSSLGTLQLTPLPLESAKEIIFSIEHMLEKEEKVLSSAIDPRDACRVILMTNQLRLIDLNIKVPKSVKSIQLKIESEQKLEANRGQIEFSPTTSGLISISGIDSRIHIFKLDSTSASKLKLSPLFSHLGHKMQQCQNILFHCWHPTLKNTLISSGSDSTLHFWTFETLEK